MLETGRWYVLAQRDDVFCIWKRGRRGEIVEHRWEENARQEFRWLERQARLGTRRRRVRLSVTAAIGCLVAVPIAIAASTDDGPDRSHQVPRPAPSDAVVNAAGGYGFRVPEGWSIDGSDSTAVLTNAAGVNISIDVAPSGDAGSAAAAVVKDMSAGWSETQIEPARPRTVGSMPAISIGGTAIEQSGGSVRFLAIVVDSGTRSHAIRVVVPEGAGPETFLPSIEGLLASFEPLGEP